MNKEKFRELQEEWESIEFDGCGESSRQLEIQREMDSSGLCFHPDTGEVIKVSELKIV